MTKNDTSSAVQAGATFTGSDGVQRRTIVAGAAWTIPVVATAIGAPLAAASGEALTLAFDLPQYTGSACGTIDNARVVVSSGGAVAPGESVTITLSGGYTFDDGSTSRPFTSGADGSVLLPPITVPAGGGDSTIVASAGAATATAALSAPRVGGAFQIGVGSGVSAFTSVPAGSEPVGSGYFLAPNGDLYYTNSVMATGIDSVETYSNQGGNFANFITAAGVAGQVGVSGVPTYFSSVPSGSTPVGSGFFLAPNGDLYYTNTVVATGVASASSYSNAGQNFANYVTTSGTAFQVGNASGPDQFTSVPLGSTPVGSGYYLTDDGDLYYTNTLVVSDVASVSTYSAQQGNYANFVTNSGAAGQAGTAGPTAYFPSVPAGSTPVGSGYYLADNGDLYYTNTVVARNVSAVSTYSNGDNFANYVVTQPCA
ncbi:hypothetical protein C1I63_03755 [Rathayibacter caricis DSM 15933]|uniref:Uncharacterized protein n=1 Tax=Rathayibacter caricis DSM 15933 TaxID=1328867 RepID=A0A2T4UR78_9MICO|nr:hypothetical protein [Rathayibacter caricis]PTL72039.1 hypothetical protein C1I63_03755 [Rathayibacter caricis DSM 15933]